MRASLSVPSRPGRRAVLATFVAGVLIVPSLLLGQAGLSRSEALRMRDKVIAMYAIGVGRPAARIVTPVSELEVNSYLAYEAGADIPIGLAQPRLTLLDGGRVIGRAIVDLDAVRRARGSSSWFDPVNYLAGKVPASLAGTLTSRDGFAWFRLESATFGGMPVPKVVLQEVVSYYSRSPEKPDGVSLDDPYPLPARIRQIDVRRGHAQVIQ